MSANNIKIEEEDVMSQAREATRAQCLKCRLGYYVLNDKSMPYESF